MSRPDEASSPDLDLRLRLALATSGLGLAALLGLAAWLTPDEAGMGTHRQLGLPPCTFLVMFDIPCPSCGMTTSWAHVMHGQLGAAMAANLGGTLLALMALVAVPWTLLSALRGRPVSRLPSDRTVIIAASAVVLVTLLDWAQRLF